MTSCMKTIFISGANRGIGLELCRQLCDRGDHIIASCRNPSLADDLQTLCRKNPHLEIVRLDVNDEKSVNDCFSRIHQRGAAIDRLFNNAGIIDWRGIEQVDADAFSKVLQTNLRGAFLVLLHALPCLRRSSNAWVFNLSSRLGSIELRGKTHLGGAIAYQCSKAGLNMLTKQAAVDLAQYGVKVISISPGWVRTEMGGPDAKYPVSESVSKIIEVTEGLTDHQTGEFFGENGEIIPW